MRDKLKIAVRIVFFTSVIIIISIMLYAGIRN